MAKKSMKYQFIGKCLWFPKEKIVCVGDLHLGYDVALKEAGLRIPVEQFEEMLGELKKTFDYVKKKYGKIKEIVFLGDIKHHFGFVKEEKQEMLKLLSFCRKYVANENRVVFIRGNHEKNYKNKKFLDYYIVKDIIFVHGHEEFEEMYGKEINLIIMGHLHPAVVLKDKMKVKKEKYKCFLKGRYKKKDVVIAPSFLFFTDGVAVNEFDDVRAGGYDFSVVSQKELEKFEVYVVEKIGEEARGFGKVGRLKNL